MRKVSSGDICRIEGVDYLCQRYRVQEKLDRGFWFMLSDPEMTYLCTKGPYISKEARDSAIITEVEKRNEQAVFKKGNK